MKIEQFIPKASAFILMTMFVLILAIFSNMLYEAYKSLTETNNMVREVVQQASKKVIDSSKTGNKLSDQEKKIYLDMLEMKSKGTLDSNTISYLFEIFSISLISAGIYLLSRSHEDLRKIKNEAKIVLRREKSNTISVEVENLFSKMFLLSCFANREESYRNRYLGELVDSTKELRVLLEDSRNDMVGFNNIFLNSFKDSIQSIKNNVEEVPRELKALELLKEELNKVESLVRSDEFKINYRRISPQL